MTSTLSPQKPHQYPKRILLAVIGMTPQIVTETLYKLAVDSEPQFIPTEVHLITTKEGAESAKIALLGTAYDKGWFHLFCEDYQLDQIQFNEENIHIITDPEGQFIDDNQSTQHNKIASDFITDKVKSFTQDDNTALHVSLAGGRKTMSYYAGYALSLYGRLQDHLSHVLVSKVFMSNKNFFYPRPKEKARRLEIDKRFYSTESAKIILSDIPYVRMRYQVPQALLEGNEGFQETVNKIEKFNQLPQVTLYRYERKVEFNGTLLALPDSKFALYYWFCLQIKEDKDPLNLNDKASIEIFYQEFLSIYKQFTDDLGPRFKKRQDSLTYDSNEQQYREIKKWLSDSKGYIRGKIIETLGGFSKPFLIKNIKKDNDTYYQLDILAEHIQIKRSFSKVEYSSNTMLLNSLKTGT